MNGDDTGWVPAAQRSDLAEGEILGVEVAGRSGRTAPPFAGTKFSTRRSRSRVQPIRCCRLRTRQGKILGLAGCAGARSSDLSSI